jgi:hypothetical protein
VARPSLTHVLGAEWEIVGAEIEVASRWSEKAGGKSWVARVTARLAAD